MSRLTQTRTIDGLEVTVVQFAATRALPLLGQITAIVGPAIGALAPMLAGDGLAGLGKRRVEDLAPALAALGAGLDGGGMMRLATGILAGTTVIAHGPNGPMKYDLSGGPSAIDACFEGRLLSLFKVAAFALEHNFSGFFPAAGQPSGAAA